MAGWRMSDGDRSVDEDPHQTTIKLAPYTSTRAERIRSGLLYARARFPLQRRFLKFVGALFLASGIVFLAFGVDIFTGILGILLGVYVLLSLDVRLQIWWRYQRDPRGKELSQETYDKQGLHYRTPSIDLDVRWNAIKQGVMVKDRYLFWTQSGGGVFVVLRRAFSSEQEWRAFDDLLRRNLGTRLR